MVLHLIKLLVLSLFSFFVIYNFYFNSPGHIENFNGYSLYVIIVGIIYGIYKFIQVDESNHNIAKFSTLKIFGFFVLHLTILSCLFFQLSGGSFGSGFLLTIKILFYMILPISIVLISIGFGKKILSYINDFNERGDIFQFLLSLGTGFFSFMFILSILGMLGLYNPIVVFAILLIMLTFSLKEFSKLTDAIFTSQYELKISEGNYMKLISAEIFFLFITLLLSVNLISVVRPFPIGWDDLGVYMNYPNIIAQAGSLNELTSIYTWQVFTGIGYMFKSPVQAFFLNNVGGFLSVISLVLIGLDIFKSKIKSTYIHIPLLLATIFISLPMVVFQQAKDMKLDSGLFFVSIIGVYIFYKLIKNGVYDKKIKSKNLLKYLFVVGLLFGFAFTIKFTTLLLISAILGVFMYSKLKLEGFIGYMAIFFAIFTKGGLWTYMNVTYPSDNISLINNFSIASGIIGLVFVIYGLVKYKVNIKKIFIKLSVIILGIGIAISPWLIKNTISSTGEKISIGVMLSGVSKSFKTDYSLIYSQEDLAKKQDQVNNVLLSDDGKSNDEDLGRYFGYDTGINNYVKMPWNLTMQLNQGGEFTGISFLFLALLPGLLMFLPYRKKIYSYGPALYMFIVLLLHIGGVSSGILTALMESINIPGGYAYILALFILPVIYLHYTLEDTAKNKLFLLNIVFFSFYTFLWSIAAFGIVWYGIVLYFNMLLMIGYGLYNLSSYKKEDSEKEKQIKLFGSIIVLVIIGIWFFNSVMPHTFNNLKKASYKEFKTGLINTTEAPFSYHREYLAILFAMNIAEDKKQDYIEENISDEIKTLVPNITSYDIGSIKSILEQVVRSQKQPSSSIARKDLNKIYAGILNPTDEYKTDIGIYRIGTFLKYYITENNKRLMEDSLVTQFSDYIYTGNADATVDNIKKLGLGYLLVDLNAATIDQDPRHDLTKRYEKLLRTFTSEKLELIDTDSMCLRVALDDFHASEKTAEDLEQYMLHGGVNYDSYDAEDNKVDRRIKLGQCYNHILSLVQEGKINENNYSYLQGLLPKIQEAQTNQELTAIFGKYVTHGYKVLFKVK